MNSIFILMFVRFGRTLRDALREREVRSVLVFLLIILLSGSIFYHLVEKWSYLDSLYFSVTTLSTVGADNISPATIAGKIFTMVYIFLGIGTMLRFINILAAHAKKEGAMHTLLGVDPYEKTKEIIQSTKDKFVS